MCEDAFSSMLQRVEGKGLFHGLKFGNNINISNLLLADDNLVFTRASVKDCQHFKHIFITILLHQDNYSTKTNPQCFLVAIQIVEALQQ